MRPGRMSIVGLCIVALAATTLGIGCGRSPEAKRDRYLAAAQKLLQKHDNGRAILQLKNAAQVAPKDAEVYYQLGMVYIAARDYNSAVASFQRALTIKPGYTSAQLRIAQIFSQTNDQELLRDAADRLKPLTEGTAPNTEALNALALTELRLGRRENAIQLLDEAVARAPGELMPALLLARAKLDEKDPRGAEEALKRACREAPQSAEARRFLGAFYVSQGRLAEGEAEIRRAVDMNPQSGVAMVELADVQYAMGRKQEAEQLYQRASNLDGYKLVYGAYLSREGRRDEGVREFERVSNANPDDRQVRTQLVAAYRSVNRTAEAQGLLERALKKNGKDFDALLQHSELLLGDGKHREAEAELAQVVKWNTNSAAAHYTMAKLRQAKGEKESYRQELTEALRLNPALLPVRVELAQNLTANKTIAAALDVLNAAPESQKSATALTVQRNWVYWVAKDYAAMRKGVEEGLLHERTPDLLLQAGMLKLQAGNPAEAQAAFEEALRINPNDLNALAALSQSFNAQKRPTLGIDRVKEYAAAQPKSAAAQQLLGLVLLADGKQPEARAAFAAARAADSNYTQADLALAQVDATERKWEAARDDLTRVLAKEPANATALGWLGDIEAINGESKAAIEHYRKAVDVNPNDARALNNLAFLVSEEMKQHEQALKYAERAVELAPDNPEYADTLGWVLYQKGLYDTAIRHLKRAAAANQNALPHYHLAMAYAKAGQAENAQSTLRAALKLNANLPEARAAVALVSQSK
jgi:tetratricopeptide (TPR) repeat protein